MSDKFDSKGPMNQARVEAVTSMSTALIKTITDELSMHGRDPHNADIISAAMALTIHKLAYVDPSISYNIATIMASGVKPGDLA